MNKLKDCLVPETAPDALSENIVSGKGYRITVLNSRLIRTEKQDENIFNDEATQIVWFRNFEKTDFTATRENGLLYIQTRDRIFLFDEKLRKATKVNIGGKWVKISRRGNLGGTRRTLDMKNGAICLGKGLINRRGVGFFKDDSMILTKDGAVKAVSVRSSDAYILAYGKDYRGGLRDFFSLTGYPPLLPKFALGNWWSRYRAYTQEEYLKTIDRFAEEKIPLSVATIDMDWHWVKVNEKYGLKLKKERLVLPEGWTGYSWNTDLFPDYRQFLRELKDRKLHITLNLHPAAGVRSYEVLYPAMADAVGKNKKSGETVEFDLSDNKFINAYFDVLHRPYEKDGVDFWWIDWQQGKKSAVEGLDPLWALNHYHYLDNSERKRGLILSRYAGLGSHRYPLGFSGDAITSRASLKFQPYFTSTAANVGYGWWSHDIGGHQFGIYSDELYLRWCQFGTFSPINRLHSTSHDLLGKEPWKRNSAVKNVVVKFMTLRHRLIPYVYTMNYLSHTEGRMLCEPMYYAYPESNEAYRAKGQYFFGTELLVCPITKKSYKSINLAETKLWVPKGRFTDIFTGKIYNGPMRISAFRDSDSIPVLAKEGAIIPLSLSEGNDISNPEKTELLIFRGNNKFVLYEDDGESRENGEFFKTEFIVADDGKNLEFTVRPCVNEKVFPGIVPEKRTYIFNFKDVKAGDVVTADGNFKFAGKFEVEAGAGEEIQIKILRYVPTDNGDPIENGKDLLARYQGGVLSKMIIYHGLKDITDPEEFLSAVLNSAFPAEVRRATREVML